jgi:hypothetical protein
MLKMDSGSPNPLQELVFFLRNVEPTASIECPVWDPRSPHTSWSSAVYILFLVPRAQNGEGYLSFRKFNLRYYGTDFGGFAAKVVRRIQFWFESVQHNTLHEAQIEPFSYLLKNVLLRKTPFSHIKYNEHFQIYTFYSENFLNIWWIIN